jgi:hypothetical protein
MTLFIILSYLSFISLIIILSNYLIFMTFFIILSYLSFISLIIILSNYLSFISLIIILSNYLIFMTLFIILSNYLMLRNYLRIFWWIQCLGFIRLIIDILKNSLWILCIILSNYLGFITLFIILSNYLSFISLIIILSNYLIFMTLFIILSNYLIFRNYLRIFWWIQCLGFIRLIIDILKNSLWI